MEKYLFRGIHYLAGPALDLKFGDVLVEDGRIKKMRQCFRRRSDGGRKVCKWQSLCIGAGIYQYAYPRGNDTFARLSNKYII